MRYKILLLMWLPALFSLRAATVPAVIAVSADGAKTSYELASVQRIVFDTGGMTLQRKAEAGDVNGVRCVLFGTMEQTPTALAEAGKTTIYAYPNPVQNYLRIEGATADATCTVYDLQGRALLHSAAQHIDVTTLQQGSYLLKISNQIIKFIKK